MSGRPEYPGFAPEMDREAAGDTPRRSRPGWLVPILLALVVFEVTANPALGIAVACLKFGLKDFRTALWLRRADPVRARGRACSWFYACFGIFKTGATAFAATCVLIVAGTLIEGPFRAAFRGQLMAAVLTIAACYGLGMLSSCMGVLIALMGGRKVWVDRRVHRAREGGYWPPHFEGPSWIFNGAGIVVLGASVVFLLIAMIPMMLLGVVLLIRFPPPPVVPAGGPVPIGIGLVAVAVAGLAAYSTMFNRMAHALRRRVVAGHPHECYPPA